MAKKMNRDTIDDLMFGRRRVRRFTQDSPVLPDVWIAYAEAIDEPVDVLITPFRTDSPAEVARLLRERLKKDRKSRKGRTESPRIAFNQTTVAARLYFRDLVRVVLPMTGWWHETVAPNRWHRQLESIRMPRRDLARSMRDPEKPAVKKKGSGPVVRPEPEIFWLTRIVAALEWARRDHDLPDHIFDDDATEEPWLQLAEVVAEVIEGVETPPRETRIYSINLNREATLAVSRSVLSIKADAARLLFDVDCSRLTWAILDSGVDARHPAFIDRKALEAEMSAIRFAVEKAITKSPLLAATATAKPKTKSRKKEIEPKRQSRVRGTWDFTEIRELLDPDAESFPPKIAERIRRRKLSPSVLKKERETLAERIQEGRDLDWSVIRPFLEIPADEGYEPPAIDHGTHVAGVLAADWDRKVDPDFPEDEPLRGVCPDIRLYDVRLFGEDGISNEFAIIAAMQFLRHLNSANDYIAVHGVNLSFSILHDVANYACGRTPVCDEAERLVSSGVVVVAAAGNKGYERNGDHAGVYNPISITDPGNAESVITVGATHREKPHSYGVSYFSSRGPTGDGRAKPDLVAPGEKILGPATGGGVARKDGTSQAAPHVSGAAALLMGRHRELIGQPTRIKQILCATATDLGRTREFQGAGMLDVLRALQSV